MKLRRLVIALLAALVGGCNFAPQYTKPPTPTPAHFKENEGWKMAQPSDRVLRGKWWEVYNDPELNALEEQASTSNQTVAAALANFLAARALVKQARAQYFPTINASPNVTRSRLSGGQSTSFTVPTSPRTVTTYALPFDASWELDLWGSVRNNVRSFVYSTQSSAANLENIRLTVQAELAVDYYELRGQDALKAVYNATIVAYQKSLELTKTLFQTGIDSDQSVAQAETQLQTAIAQGIALDVQRAQLEHAIAMLAGQPASTFSIPVKAMPATPPSIPVSLPSELLERRPDVAAAERTVAQANAQIGIARAAYFPTLTLSGSTGFQSTALESLFAGPSFFWSIGGTAAETLFDAGRRSGVTEQAWANYRQTVANYRQTVLTAFQDVEDNLAALRILAQQLQQQQVAIAAAQRNLALSNQRYFTGVDSYLNVITAQTALLNNQQTAVTIQIQQMTASVQLIKALGGGWSAAQMPPTKGITTAVPPL